MNGEKDGRTKKLSKIIDKPACRKSLFDTLRAVFPIHKLTHEDLNGENIISID